ncbi:hypothetical protein D3261_08715 [Halococcus sp. IIIV-5B]|nr:hypothetical protein D3261_08715 [Halococcus sp. IIIV-5B]
MLALIAICGALAIASGGVGAQTSSGNNSTPGGIQQAHEKAQFAFETPAYISDNLPFGTANVRNVGVSTVRLYWNTSNRSQRLSMQAYPSQNATLFRGNSGILDTENVTINGQLGDYSEPQTPNGTGTVTFVSESNVTYLVTGTYDRSTLLRVARSIGQERNSSAASTSANVTNTTALENTLTIESTGDERVYYNATASEKLHPAGGADLAQSNASSPDVVTDSTASGSTAKRGVDNYTFAGNLTALDLRGGPAKVLVNGEQVDPDSFATATPTATSTPTRTSTSATTTVTASTTPENSSIDRTPVGTITEAQTVAESENGSSGGSSGFGPGFGILPAMLALVAIVLAVARRR